ncbi:MAG: cell wall hydrolase [Oscillospiraceae bacterium]|nr:cell wall hydrolase [Oscillospiraceae bacterium]
MNIKNCKIPKLKRLLGASLALVFLCAGLAIPSADAGFAGAVPAAVLDGGTGGTLATVTVCGGRLPAYSISGRIQDDKIYIELSNFLSVVFNNDAESEFAAEAGSFYLGYAGSYYWIEEGVTEYEGSLWVQAADIAKAFSAKLDVDRNHAIFTRDEGVPLWYTEEDVYWMSRIIQAESGGEPLIGQIAVGNVVMNRKNGKYYSNTVKGVIFDPGQFSPASSGSLNVSPREKAIIAAHLSMQGMSPVGNAMYFCANGSLWGGRRTFVTRIQNHYFYV